MANQIIRTIHAALGETIEVHWVDRRWDEPGQCWLEERLVERHIAPPRETWKVRVAAQERLPDVARKESDTVPGDNRLGGVAPVDEEGQP